MGHDSSTMGHDSAKIDILGSTWELLGWFWEHFWLILASGLDSKKHLKTLGFLRFFTLLGCLGGVAEASWGLS